jgi:hypothetical protein
MIGRWCGHLTDHINEGSISGVVFFEKHLNSMVAAGLNELQTMVGDVSSAYLEAYTKVRKVCIVAGPEFGALQGYLLITERTLMVYIL